MTLLALIALLGLIIPALVAAVGEIGDRIQSHKLQREVSRTFAGAAVVARKE